MTLAETNNIELSMLLVTLNAVTSDVTDSDSAHPALQPGMPARETQVLSISHLGGQGPTLVS